MMASANEFSVRLPLRGIKSVASQFHTGSIDERAMRPSV
jgi:hypothetical protein